MFKSFVFLMLALLMPLNAVADKPEMSDKEYEELLAKSPFNKMYPKSIAPGAARAGTFNSLFTTAHRSPRRPSGHCLRLCRRRCILHRSGSPQPRGACRRRDQSGDPDRWEVARFSILLYGNEFGQDSEEDPQDRRVGRGSAVRPHPRRCRGCEQTDRSR